MAGYLSLFLQLEDEPISADILEPAFASAFFEPVSVGAVDAHESGDNWFFAGYALEDFIARFLERGIPEPASIEIGSSDDSVQHDYLQRVADHLSYSIPLTNELSPFERQDPKLGVTYVEPFRLRDSILPELNEWLARFPAGVIYLYGSAKIAMQRPPGLPGQRAFRYLYQREQEPRILAVPLLQLRMSSSAFVTQVTEINFRSESTIWLREAYALKGLVGPLEADENVQNLFAFAESLVHNRPLAKYSAELHTEGSIFGREVEQLEEAIAGTLGKK